MPLAPGRPNLAFIAHLKSTSLIFFPTALLLALVLSLFFYFKLQNELETLKTHEWSHVEAGQHAITHEFKAATTDLACLASSTVLRNFLTTNSKKDQADLGHEYLVLAANSQMYDQIRLLATDGMERVRINFQQGQPAIVPPADLQHKGRRYYFTDTFSLRPGEIFVSPLDLNIEQGRIELPQKPMIRFGTPVFDAQGHKRGIVLLNYFGQILLDHLQQSMQGSATEHSLSSPDHNLLAHHQCLTGKPMLLNQQGFWLLSLNPEDEWGFMYQNDRTMANTYPAAWQRMPGQPRGQFFTPEGLFTFITIKPLQLGQISSTGSPHAFQKSARKQKASDYQWHLVSFVSQQDLQDFYTHFIKVSLFFYGALLLLLLPASFYFGRQRLLKLQSEETSQRYEFIVNKSQDMMTLIDQDYRYLAVNDAFCDLLNKRRTEILGRTVADVWGEEVFNELIQTYLDMCLAGSLTSYSTWIATPTVDNRFYDVTLSPFKDQGQDTYYGVVVSRDITSRKRGEEKLRDVKNMWEETFDAVPDLIAIIDCNYKIQQVNRAMAQALGLEADQCLGQTCYEAVHCLAEPLGHCPHSMLLADGQQHEAEVVEDRLGGEFLVTVSPLHDTQGQLTGSVHVARDITARKRSLRQIERLAVLKETLLREGDIQEKMQHITDGVLEMFGADFCRIWLIAPGDRCQAGCFHAETKSGPHVCRSRERCLHLVASSGRYTHLDGKGHARVPFGCYKIGRIASEEDSSFLTNDVCHDPRVHDHAWAKELGLQAFAGYRLLSKEGKPLGVLALFSTRTISPEEETLLAGIANTTSQVIRVQQTEDKLLEAHDRMQTILDNVDAMIYITDIETYEILMINQYGRDIFGAVEGQKCWQALQKGQDGPCPFCKANGLSLPDADDFHPKVWEVQNSINGNWYEIHDNRISWIDGRWVRLQVATDVSERKATEEKLHEYASIQKTLLREVNHRVKNNLAAIIAMLHMEESRVAGKDDVNYGEAIQDLVARIHGLAMVHTLLTASEWLPLKISYLCKEVATAALHGLPRGKEIEVAVEDASTIIGSSQAHHLALVINELTTNTLKYSLKNRDKARIDIAIKEQEDDLVTIVFQDDGPGYPADICGGDMSRASTGMKIIEGIIRSSLQGTVHFGSDNGAVTRFTFKNELDNEM